MANVLVTTSCPHGCSCCFASELARTAGAASISEAAFGRCLDWIEESGGHEVRLVGGEPTAHPALPELMAMALDRGLGVTILTGGLIEPRLADAVAETPESRVSVVFNLNAAAGRDGLARLEENLDRLAPRGALACTIDRLPFPSDGLEQLARRPTLRQPVTIRLGLAHPGPSGRNAWIRPSRYASVARRVRELALRLDDVGARVELDCGFVRCAFDDEAVSVLERTHAVLRFQCRPIIDLTPDGRVLHCLALGDRWSCAMAGPMPEIRRRMLADRAGFDEVGVFPDCRECGWKAEGVCDGGCMSVRLRRFRVAPVSTVSWVGRRME